MKILVLGGTQFVGRHLVEAFVRAGHEVSIFSRGQSPDELPRQVERLRGDRDQGAAGLAPLQNRTWDVCVDVSGYTAVQVRASAELLAGNVGQYVFTSAVSVYGNPPAGPVDEDCPRSAPAPEDVVEVAGEMYGRLKVTCENIVEQLYPGRCAQLRPQIVAGPFDPFDRFSYWVRRAAQPGPILAPGDGSDYMQVIDVDDLAQFTLLVCEQGLSGPYNLAGPRITWSEFMAALGASDLVWTPHHVLAEAGLTETELPLYRPIGGYRSSLMHVSHDRAVKAGLKLSDPAVTIAKVRRWLPHCTLPPALAPEREAQLLGR